jgi:ABC-type oligopeptide transport system substrate-binding subunit
LATENRTLCFKKPGKFTKRQLFFALLSATLVVAERFFRFCAKMNGMRLFFLKRWLRFTAAVLAAAFLFALTGCGSSTNSASFTWFVDSIPANLDPQVASGASDMIACENLYGTLVRKDPDGKLVPGLCESWTVSPDGLTYTFTLKDGLTYAAAKGAATEYAITAEDFVFAFRRIFRAGTASPYAVEFPLFRTVPPCWRGRLTKAVWAFRPTER